MTAGVKGSIMFSQASSVVRPATPPTLARTSGRGSRTFVIVLLLLSSILTMAYVVISFYIATMLVYAPQKPPYSTPAAFGLQYHNVTFPSRQDHVQLQGWF